ncbi:MAG: hypothetical protein ABIJ28_02130 [Patescibacteria group bacterium]
MKNMLGIADAKGPIYDLLEKLGGADGEKWLRDLKKFLRKEISLIHDWQSFWYSITGQEYDFSTVHIPAKPEGNWRLLICIDISLETLYAECHKRFSGKVWRWTDKNLDEIVVQNERTAQNCHYAIWVRNETESDENLKNLSSNDIKNQNLTTETLAERLIHELKHFQETGKHLDIKNVTLCAGSRDVDGSVPGVGWFPGCGGMSVGWCGPGFRDDSLCARQAVS